MRRLFRSVILAAVVAAGVAAAKALTRKDDPLPSPAAAPAGGPWPPLRNETAAPIANAEVPVTKPAEPATTPTPKPKPAVVPEPDGVPVADAPTGSPWVEPDADGECPASHPIKAKMKSKIFHAPGQLNYDRTTPDRCYVDAAAAEADGLRAAKR